MPSRARAGIAAGWLLLLAGAAAPGRYANPVFDTDFPDPAVLRAPDGHYYAYATQGPVGAGTHNVQLARSADLVRWERLPDAMPVKPAWARRTQDLWAPDVSRRDGRYVMYFSAKPDAALTDESKGLCLGVATAARPEGPFTDSGAPLVCGTGFVNIDPFAFDDPATGKKLLYWGSGFGPIKVQELAPDRQHFAPGSSPVALVETRQDGGPNDYQRLIEGAWVVARDGWYYLFYSGDNCCGPEAHYAVLVARSRSATGPFEKRPGGNVILAANRRWLAPGHVSVIDDKAGASWLVYHAIDTRRPRTRPADAVNSRRVLLIDRIIWRGGWPEIATGGPSSTPQPAPARR